MNRMTCESALESQLTFGFHSCSRVLRRNPSKRMLRHELFGYDEYARQVRFRLIPGVW